MATSDGNAEDEVPPEQQPSAHAIVTAIHSAASVVTNLIRWGFGFLIVREVYRIVAALAGESTFADIGIEIDVLGATLGQTPVSHGIAFLLAVVGLMYGLRQAKLRRDTVERLQGRIRELERGLDPNRTSSGITPRGTTQPEDRI